MTQVLLIEPPATNVFGNLRTLGSIGTFKADMAWPPLELMTIAGYLKGIDVESHIFDAVTLRAGWGEVKRIIDEQQPQVVIFTTSTPTIYHDLQTACIAKGADTGIKTIAIGTHVTALPVETLRSCPELDVVCIGESELTIREYIQRGFEAARVKGGIAYRRNGEIIANTAQNICENLDELGFPAHDKVPLGLYHDPFSRLRPMSVTYGSRGCVNQPPCIMCSACFFAHERYRSADSLINEMHWLKVLGVKEIRFPFESGFHDLTLANELFKRMVSEQVGLRFSCNARADHLSLPLLRLMREAGCSAVNIGCESVDENVSKMSQKKISPEAVVEAVRHAKKCGLEVLVYFIFGLPYETKKSMKKTLDFAKKLGADMVTFGVAIPHPGTVFYGYLKSRGYLRSEDWSLYDPMFPPPYGYPELSSEEIFAFANHAYRSFYLNPRFLLSRAQSVTSLRHIRDNLKLFKGFMQRYVLTNR